MIILLVLLPALLLSEEASKIDLTKCGENFCYCSVNVLGLDEYQYEVTTDPQGNANDNLIELEDKCTEMGLQNKFFNENHALFQIQARLEDGEQLVDGSTLELYQGPKLIFGCKLDKGEVKLIEKAENKEFVRKYKISLFEDRSIMKNKFVLCAIQSKKTKNIVNEQHGIPLDKTSVKLSWNNKIYINNVKKTEFFEPQRGPRSIKCDPYAFKDLPTSKKYIFHSLRNRDADVLNCENYNVNTDLFTMKYKNKNSNEDHEIKQLKCEYKNYDYYFIPGKIDPADETKIIDMEEITDPESHYFYCAAHFDDLCESPTKGCADTETNICPVYKPGKKVEPGEKRDPATLTCTDKRWLINKEYYELEVYCMKNFLGDSNTAIFFAKLPSGRYIPVPEDAKCFTKYDCRLKSKLELPKEKTSGTDGLADDSDGILKCKNPDRILTIYNAEQNKTMNSSTSYKCDPVTGSWADGSEIVPSNSRVRCKDLNAGIKREKIYANMSENQVIYLIIGVAVGIILLIIVIGIAYHFISKHKHKLKFTKLTKMRMTKEEFIADCRGDFIAFQLATPSSDHLIVEGFKKMDRLLKQEIGDPEAWVEAFNFLQRFHGVITKTDWKIRHMLCRYLYLQAKKIIDKDGWSTKTKIRNKKRDGLMRVIAAHLLTYAWDDHQCADTAELIMDGYRELGFKGLSQYPHCGFLWYIVNYVKPTSYEHATDKRRVTFNPETFITYLKDIMQSEPKWHIAKQNQIPTFGSVSQQAAFALGASPNLNMVTSEAKSIVLTPDPKGRLELQKSFFEGMMKSPIRTPALSIIEGFNMVFKPDPDNAKKDKDGKPEPTSLELLHTVAPAAEWEWLVKDASRISTYYGRFIDTKRLYERFMPNGPHPDFLKMQLEQKQFEDAVEKGKEDIRAWFAANTDKAEYKKKPDYSKVPALDFGVGDFKTPKNACTPVEGKSSGSKSSGGGSDSKNSDGKSPAAAPPPPSDPNAAPAAKDAAAAPPSSDPNPAAAAPAAPAPPAAVPATP